MVVALRLHVRFSDMASWIRLICAFPQLESLTIRGSLATLQGVGHELPSPTAFHLSPSLRALEVDFCGLEVFLKWLLALPVRPALHSVCFHHILMCELDAIGKLITTLEDSLEYLSLSASAAGGVLSLSIM
jgi:hypothetical protein